MCRKPTGEFQFVTLLGCEYYNMCNLLWSKLLKDNTDTQVLMNSEGKQRTTYVTKYVFKHQLLESSLTMRIGLMNSAVERVLERPDDDSLTIEERGRRFINCVLYKFTKPQEIPATLAALGLINDGNLFFRSHEPARLRLDVACACYKEPITYNGAAPAEDAYIRYSLPTGATTTTTGASLLTVGDDDDDSGGDFPMSFTLNRMNDYWFRPASMEQFNYITVLERFHLVSGTGSLVEEQMNEQHPRPLKNHWVKNLRRCVGIVFGKPLPNIKKKGCRDADKEFFYKALLILFKPHKRPEDILDNGMSHSFYTFFTKLVFSNLLLKLNYESMYIFISPC